MSNRIKVLVADDSAFARKVVREVLAASPHIDVVGIARDGLEALEQIEALKPDVLTLDLLMPHLDGIGVLRALPATGANRPRVVVVSISDEDSALGVEALHLGAFDVVKKPTALATDRLYELGAELVAKVEAAAGARSVEPGRPVSQAAMVAGARGRHGIELVVIGTSTGGPQALTRLLTAFPADFPVPIAIALHIPEGYTRSLAERLDRNCQLSVAEAEDGAPLRPGQALLAPGGSHLRIVRRGSGLVAAVEPRLAVSAGDKLTVAGLHVPSVSLLFETAAAELGRAAMAVVLTGMGDDGLAGAAKIRAAGGTVLTEAESSCVVYGMPRCVWEAGLAAAEAPLDGMAALIIRSL
jgi:two-component system chemotaxis response regulator CheB